MDCATDYEVRSVITFLNAKVCERMEFTENHSCAWYCNGLIKSMRRWCQKLTKQEISGLAQLRMRLFSLLMNSFKGVDM